MPKVVRTAPSSGGRSPATGLSVESCGPPVARAALALREVGLSASNTIYCDSKCGRFL